MLPAVTKNSTIRWTWLLTYLLAAIACAAQSAPVVATGGMTMGSTWSVKYRLTPETLKPAAIERALQNRLDELEHQMSTWRTDSVLSRFNTARDTNWFPVPRDTAVVVREALEVSRLTDGAFDVTVFPLVQLWGFGPGGRKGHVPTDAEIAAALKRVGWRKLEARLDPPSLRKSQPDLAIDLSALCPGYATDCLGEILSAHGIKDFLVDVGGELKARGHGTLGPGWRVGVERPEPRAGGLQPPSVALAGKQTNNHQLPSPILATTLTLANQSLATAGDYRNFFTLAGRRYSHHLDSRTGRPTESPIASVSVLHANTMHADALGTGLTVLGFAQAVALAEREHLAVYFVLRAGNTLRIHTTKAWPASPPQP